MEILANAPIVHIDYIGEDQFGNRQFGIFDEDGEQFGGNLMLWFSGMSMKWSFMLTEDGGFIETNFSIPRGCQDIQGYTKGFLRSFLAQLNLDLRFDDIGD